MMNHAPFEVEMINLLDAILLRMCDRFEQYQLIVDTGLH